MNPQLYYLHIPKVAGTSLSAVLTDHFAADSICPAQSWRDLGTQEIEPFSLVRGHYGVPGAEFLPSAGLVTVLCKPAPQVVSLYEHMDRGRCPGPNLSPILKGFTGLGEQAIDWNPAKTPLPFLEFRLGLLLA